MGRVFGTLLSAWRPFNQDRWVSVPKTGVNGISSPWTRHVEIAQPTRASTPVQNPDHQIDALTRAGVTGKNSYLDHASGAKTSRPKLDELIGKLRDGDTLAVTRLDRLSRSIGITHTPSPCWSVELRATRRATIIYLWIKCERVGSLLFCE